MTIKIGDRVRVRHNPPMPAKMSLEFLVEEIVFDGRDYYATGRSIHSGAWIRWDVDELEVIKEN